jgi:hypothetical protein
MDTRSWHKYSVYVTVVSTMVICTVVGKVPSARSAVSRGIGYTRRHKGDAWLWGVFVVFSMICIWILADATLPMLLGGYIFGFKRAIFLNLLITNVSGYVAFERGLPHPEGTPGHVSLNHSFDVIRHLPADLSTLEWAEVVLLTRLNPLYPYHFISSLWGGTAIPRSVYMWASFLGFAPYTALITYLGASLPKPSHIFTHTSLSFTPKTLLVGIIGMCLTLVTHLTTSHILQNHRHARKEDLKTVT